MKRRDITPFSLRLQSWVKERARAEADRNRRSMNTEIEILIEEGLKWREMQEQHGQVIA